MSPRSRGRPPGRGPRRVPSRRPASGRDPRFPRVQGEGNQHEENTDCWFDEPDPAHRRSWAMPAGHGSYQGIDLELLDPGDEGELTVLIEAQHPEFEHALRDNEEVLIGGEPMSPRLHVVMHQIVVNQVMSDDPPEVWQTVQRLDRLGYDWHNIMHMIAALVSEDIYRAMAEHQTVDPVGYARRLGELPGDWPPPHR
jgi:hypothetical protein